VPAWLVPKTVPAWLIPKTVPAWLIPKPTPKSISRQIYNRPSRKQGEDCRVARFFLVEHTKKKNIYKYLTSSARNFSSFSNFLFPFFREPIP
jgi:hypothetical protein